MTTLISTDILWCVVLITRSRATGFATVSPLDRDGWRNSPTPAYYSLPEAQQLLAKANKWNHERFLPFKDVFLRARV